MIDRDDMQQIAEAALEACDADQAEIAVADHESGVTRFANNHIHQNVYESNVGVRMRAIVGRRIAVGSTNDTAAESLERLAARVTQLARHSAIDDDFVSLPRPADEQTQDAVRPVARTVEFGPSQRAEAVGDVIAVAEGNDLTAAGRFATGRQALYVANSLGIRSFYAKSHAETNVLMQGEDSSGFASDENQDVGEIDPISLAQIAAEKAIQSAVPDNLQAGQYTVILEPLAVADMVSMLAMYDLNALAHQEGRSFTTGRIGEKVCGQNISMWDDGWDPRGDPTPFDYEGVPRQRVSLIDGGTLRAVTYDSYTAGREEGAINTGHALPAPNTWGPVPTNLFVDTGDHTVEEMIAATDRGILVTRFHYTNMVHPVHTIFTGMTRDGTFLVEDGQVRCGVKNMRFTQSILEALSNADMIGSTGVQTGTTWVPAMRVQRFNFTSATDF